MHAYFFSIPSLYVYCGVLWKTTQEKRQFTKEDIARMRPSFIRPYMITGHINRLYFERNIKKINQIRKNVMPYAKPFM